jgi:hypothetical protein
VSEEGYIDLLALELLEGFVGRSRLQDEPVGHRLGQQGSRPPPVLIIGVHDQHARCASDSIHIDSQQQGRYWLQRLEGGA